MESKIDVISRSAQDTYDFGVRVALELESGKYGSCRVVCLRGILGSGKTVFAKGFLEGFGVKSRVLSPTYTISRSYEVQGKTLWHFDLYRTRDTSDVLAVGMKEVLSDLKAIVLIEWSEKMAEILPNARIEITLDVTGDESRNIHMSFLK